MDATSTGVVQTSSERSAGVVGHTLPEGAQNRRDGHIGQIQGIRSPRTERNAHRAAIPDDDQYVSLEPQAVR